jgi:hypothetical protein
MNIQTELEGKDLSDIKKAQEQLDKEIANLQFEI